jgi:hypothetical protein
MCPNELVFTRRYRGQVPGEKDPDPLGAVPGGAEEVGEHVPIFGPVAGFFEQLSLCSRQQVLPRHVPQAGRDLPQQPAHRVPVLLDHQDPVTVVQCDHCHCAGVRNHRAFCIIIFRHEDLVGPHGDQPAAQ